MCGGPGYVISFLASSRRPEVMSGSSLGLYINPRAGACRRREEGRRSVLIRRSGSLLRPRRTGAAGNTAALTTGWPFQRRCEKPICDLAARQKHDRLERAAGPCASPRG